MVGGALVADKPLEGYWYVGSLRRYRIVRTCAWQLLVGSFEHATFHIFLRCRLNIDPVHLEKTRSKGKMDDRQELGMIESSMTYGCDHTANQRFW